MCSSDLFLKQKYKDKIIGSGAECVVTPIEGKEQKVAAYAYQELSPYKAKKIFYLQRIFSTLFPHNFPHFFASLGSLQKEDEQRLTGTIREKISGRRKTSFDYKFEGKEWDITLLDRARMLFKRNPKNRYPFKKVETECLKLGLFSPIGHSSGNFVLGTDGGEYYVDTLKHLIGGTKIDKIKKYMVDHDYSDQDIRLVEKSFERLNQLETGREKSI